MRRNRIVFWQGQPSPHQSSYLRALANLLPGTTVIGVFEHLLEKERLALGWVPADLGLVEVIVSPNQRAIVKLALHDPENTVHIFSEVRRSLTRRALPICARTRALIGLLSEAREWRGWRGKLRILHSYVAERRYRRRVDFVLAIGHLGIRWFKICGYPPKKIFPWGYFVENCDYGSADSIENGALSSPISISFVGQLIARKDVKTLIAALSRTRSRDWRLQIIGDGPQRQEIVRFVKTTGVATKVAFMGTRNNDETRRILAKSDLLVLPSRFDGWGAVVNEALMSGVPVVCSDYCGAADLVRAGDCGELFRTESAEDLTRVLDKWIARGPLTDARRAKIRSWSKCIEGNAAAQHLIEILDHVEGGRERPVAPWFRAAPVALWPISENHGATQAVASHGPAR